MGLWPKQFTRALKMNFENNFPFVPQCNATAILLFALKKNENRESQQNALSKQILVPSGIQGLT